MSIFDFVKAAGKKIGLVHDSAQAKTDSKLNTADEIKNYIDKLGLGIENTVIHVEGDKAIIEGKAPSQEALEKAVLAVGNTDGIAKVESRLTTPASQPSARFYTVKPGDTLSKIAKEQLGDAKRYSAIFEANRPLLKDPDEIYPGQNLRIPQQESA